MGKIDLQEINQLRNIINSNMRFIVQEYKGKSRSLNSRLNSVISSYSDYGDVTSKAREIIRILNEIDSATSNINTSYTKLVEGLKNVASSVKEEERDSSTIITSNRQRISTGTVSAREVSSRSTSMSNLNVRKETKVNEEVQIEIGDTGLLIGKNIEPVLQGINIEEENQGLLSATALNEFLDAYVNFTYTDADGNSVKVQIPYDWGAKFSTDKLKEMMSNNNLKANDPNLESKLKSLAEKEGASFGIDCSGLVLRAINEATNGAALDYYRSIFKDLPQNSDESAYRYGVSASSLTSLKYSTQITKFEDLQPGDYIRFDNGGHIGIINKIEGNTIHYVHSSGGKGPHEATITVSEAGMGTLDLKNSATFTDWDSKYSKTIQGLFNYVCRPNFMVGETVSGIEGTSDSGQIGNVNSEVISEDSISDNTIGSIEAPEGIVNKEVEVKETWLDKIEDFVTDIADNVMEVLKGIALVGAVLLNPTSSQYIQFVAAITAFLAKKLSSKGLNPVRSESDLSYLEGGVLYENIGGKIYKNGELVAEEDYKYIPHEVGGLRITDGRGTFAKAYVENGTVYEKIGDQIYKNGVLVPEENYKYIPKEIGGLRDTIGKGSYVIASQTYVEGTNIYQRIGGIVYKNGEEVSVDNYKYIPQEIGGIRELEGNGNFAQGYKEGEHTYIKIGEIIYKNGKEVGKEEYKYIPQEIGGLRETIGGGSYITNELIDMIGSTGTSAISLEGEELADYWRNEIVEFAELFEGKIPYCRDTVITTQDLDPNNLPKYMDCSDFTSSVYKTLFNIKIGVNCATQIQGGTSVARNELEKGDLIFFDWDKNGTPDHVGIYIGDGKFIHESGDITDPTALDPDNANIKISNLSSNNYSNGYMIAKRLVQDSGEIKYYDTKIGANNKLVIENETINIQQPSVGNVGNNTNIGTMSMNGIEFLTDSEGYNATPYRGQDAYNLTIGYGHVIRAGETFTNITESKAKQLLLKDLEEGGYVKAVTNLEKELGIKFSQNEFDALVSFSYNLGPNKLSSTDCEGVRTMLKSGNYTEKELMDEISIFHHYRAEKNGPLLDSRGLYNRRIDEAELFLYGDYTRRTDREIEG